MSYFEKRAEQLEKSTEIGQLQYTKAPHATGDGLRYEERCAALMFLRCLREGLQFNLSTNDAAGGKFEDLVLCWKEEGSPNSSTLLVQLKHKTSVLQTTIDKANLMGSKDFCLQKYYKSYNKIRDTLNVGSYALVLYTNIDVHEEAQNMFIKLSQETVPGMKLLETGGCCYSLNPEDKDVKRAVRGDDKFMKHYNQFVQHFYLFCNQKNSAEIESNIQEELKTLLIVDDESCNAISKDLCESVRLWMDTRTNNQNDILTSKWDRWLSIVDSFIKKDVTSCNSLKTGIKYTRSCVETLESHMRGCNPAWIRPPGQEATPLTTTKVHQAISGERHIVVSAERFPQLRDKIMRCWGRFCQWLVLVDDVENSFDTLLLLMQSAGDERRLVIVSHKTDEAFWDTCESSDISDDSWKELIEVPINLTSELHLCFLKDLCDMGSLKMMLDGKPEELIALSQLLGGAVVLLQ